MVRGRPEEPLRLTESSDRASPSEEDDSPLSAVNASRSPGTGKHNIDPGAAPAQRPYHQALVGGDETLTAADESLVVRPLGRVLVVGRAEPVTIYELLGTSGETDSADPGTLERFGQALEDYSARRFEDSQLSSYWRYRLGEATGMSTF